MALKISDWQLPLMKKNTISVCRDWGHDLIFIELPIVPTPKPTPRAALRPRAGQLPDHRNVTIRCQKSCNCFARQSTLMAFRDVDEDHSQLWVKLNECSEHANNVSSLTIEAHQATEDGNPLIQKLALSLSAAKTKQQLPTPLHQPTSSCSTREPPS